MTVAELIEALKNLPPELPVVFGYETQEAGYEVDSIEVDEAANRQPIVRIS